ncbi:unnamed protein product [Closterium sp. Naga37s-1]|nr:unnamed protein product [Closterium sp. Naga37s-1]
MMTKYLNPLVSYPSMCPRLCPSPHTISLRAVRRRHGSIALRNCARRWPARPARYAPLPARYAPLPARYAPLPARYAPLPARYAPLPARYAPLLRSGISFRPLQFACSITFVPCLAPSSPPLPMHMSSLAPCSRIVASPPPRPALGPIICSSAATHAEAREVVVGGNKGWTYGVSRWKPTPAARAGDVLVFKWTGYHDVWLMSGAAAYNSCNFNGAKEKAKVASGKTYRFTVPTTARGSTLYFGCQVYGHCGMNMKVAVAVQK